jgi:hypothetical protein
MDASLIDLMEQLVRAIEVRDASPHRPPAPETLARIERLELELAVRLADARDRGGRHGRRGSLRLTASPLAAGH